jgi:hypothetical protein
MNHSLLSAFNRHIIWIQKNSLSHSIACILRIAIAMTFLTHTAWAADGRACLPNGFDSFSPISPNVITLKNNISSDQLLSKQTVIDNFRSRACTEDTDVELSYVFLYSNLFVRTYFVGGYTFNSEVTIPTNRPNLVTVNIEIRTNVPNAFSNLNHAFRINYSISVSCNGGLGAYSPSSDEVRITGVNSAACRGNYQVRNTYEIYQHGNINLKAGYNQAREIQGFRSRVSFYSGSTQTNTVLTMIPNSNQTVFQSSFDCNYALTRDTLDLGNHSNVDIFRQTNTQVAFNINATGCSYINGGGNTHGLYVFWSFDAVDPNDSTILTNTSSGSNAAVNVGAKISCNNGAAVARNNASVQLTTAMSTSNSFACRAYLVPTSNVTNPNEIRPGSFTSRATLTFQFD